jgi:hypothetical protein
MVTKEATQFFQVLLQKVGVMVVEGWDQAPAQLEVLEVLVEVVVVAQIMLLGALRQLLHLDKVMLGQQVRQQDEPVAGVVPVQPEALAHRVLMLGALGALVLILALPAVQ